MITKVLTIFILAVHLTFCDCNKKKEEEIKQE